ncbi:MAG: endonuclease/exonuclease/phosphatase family protein [Bdellovibrionales bacterium]
MKKAITIAFVLIAAIYQGYNELGPTKKISAAVDQKRISIMAYNVENLFDTLNDPKKNDETFLPKSKKNKKVQQKCKQSSRSYWVKECLETNWTTFKLDMKMKRLATVVKGYKKSGPDILILEEVENKNVLNMFNDKHLGYKNVILLEGPDKRGIDVAILTKLESAKKAKLHLQRTASSRVKATRGILEAFLKLPNNETLSVFGVHFPSQGSPTKAREDAIDLLNRLQSKRSHLSISGGDFNITKNENHLYKKNLSKNWKVSHLIGCKKCKGSNYYHRKRSWSFLDALLFSKNFGKTWKIDKASIDIFNKLDVQKNRHGSPKKFNMGKDQTGVSDHWPVVGEIYL